MMGYSHQSLDADEEFVREAMTTADNEHPQQQAPAPHFTGADDDEEVSRAELDALEAGATSTQQEGSSSSLAEGSDDVLPEISQACVQFIIDATAKEERAMVFDRAGAYPGAVKLYREAAALLSEALHLMPREHPDAAVINVHLGEIHTRAGYLYSLGVEPAEIPLEDHIHGAQLSIGPCAKGNKTSIAAGALIGVTGLVLVGPITGVALAAGAAYATTRQDGIGQAARGVGDIGLRAAEHTQALNQEYRFDKKLDDKLGITEKASVIDERLHITEIAHRAGETARAVDGKLDISGNASLAAKQTQSFVKAVDSTCGISRNSQAAAAQTAKAWNEFDEKHQVSDKVNYHVAVAASTVSETVSKTVLPWVSRTVSSAMLGTSQPKEETLG